MLRIFFFFFFFIGNISFIDNKYVMFTMVNKLYLKQLQINQREDFLFFLLRSIKCYNIWSWICLFCLTGTLTGLVVFLALSVPYWGLFGDSEPERSSLQDLNVSLTSSSV